MRPAGNVQNVKPKTILFILWQRIYIIPNVSKIYFEMKLSRNATNMVIPQTSSSCTKMVKLYFKTLVNSGWDKFSSL